MQEKILLDPMFDVPGSEIVDVIINEEVVRGKKSAQYVHHPKDDSPEVEEEPIFEDQEMSARSP